MLATINHVLTLLLAVKLTYALPSHVPAVERPAQAVGDEKAHSKARWIGSADTAVSGTFDDFFAERPASVSATRASSLSKPDTNGLVPAASVVDTMSSSAARIITPSASPDQTSTSRNATDDPWVYYIRTKEGTPLDTFKSFIIKLDGAVGAQVAYPEVDFQGYQTNLTVSQVESIKKIDFVGLVYRLPEPDEQTYDDMKSFEIRGSPNDSGDSSRGGQASERTETAKSKGNLLRRDLKLRKRSTPNLKMLSSAYQFDEGEDSYDYPHYLADRSLGEGTTIFIVDTGFNLQVPDLLRRHGRILTHVVPNAFTLNPSTLSPDMRPMPEDLTDWKNHGTRVATVAGGKRLGVASRADLYLIKYRNAAEHVYTDRHGYRKRQLVHPDPGPAAFDNAFGEIVSIIVRVGTRRRYSINLSWGYSRNSRGAEAVEPSMQYFLRKFDELNAAVIVAAGDDPSLNVRLHETAPQAYGRDRNSLITAGGVKPNGMLYFGTHLPEPGRGGSITVYSQAVHVWTHDNTGEVYALWGTSLGAPAVTGLIAYFLGHPEFGERLSQGHVGINVKRFLVENSHQRVPHNRRATPDDVEKARRLPFPYEIPEWLNVPYNLAREGSGGVYGKRDEGEEINFLDQTDNETTLYV